MKKMLWINGYPITYIDDNFYYGYKNSKVMFYPTVVANQLIAMDIIYTKDCKTNKIAYDCQNLFRITWYIPSWLNDNKPTDYHTNILIDLTHKQKLSLVTENDVYHKKDGIYYDSNDNRISPVIFHCDGSWYLSTDHHEFYKCNYSKIIEFDNHIKTLNTISTLL